MSFTAEGGILNSKHGSYSNLESRRAGKIGWKRQNLATCLLYGLLFILSFAHFIGTFGYTSNQYPTSRQTNATSVTFDWEQVRTTNASCALVSYSYGSWWNLRRNSSGTAAIPTDSVPDLRCVNGSIIFINRSLQAMFHQVPLDYSHPTGEKAVIAVIRIKARVSFRSKYYRGPILFNPG